MTTHDSPASKLNVGYILLLSLVAAFGGFLFGYDTGVVNGSIDFFTRYLGLEKDSIPAAKGFAAGVMLLGCMCGVMLAGPIGDRIGRKRGLILCGLLFGVSSVVTAFPETLGQFAWVRFAGGIAIGAISILSPIYIAEIAPERIRGRLVSLYQLAIVFGISGAFFVNMLIQRQGDAAWNEATGWRLMFAVLALPSAIFSVLVLIVPESPRWLVKTGRQGEGRAVLERIGGAEVAAREMAQIEEALKQEEGRWSELFASGYLRALIVGAALAVFSQFSGINTIMYYSTDVFKKDNAAVASTETVQERTDKAEGRSAGPDAADAESIKKAEEDRAAFMKTVIVGGIMIAFTFVATWLVDRAGRRPLLLFGTAGQTISLVLVGATFFFDMKGPWLLLGILGFVAAFAMAMGPVSWIVNSEIFPNKFRGRAMGLSILLLWFADYLVTQTFPMLESLVGKSWTFWMYAGFSLASLLFVFFFLPETKGKTLEEIEASWRR